MLGVMEDRIVEKLRGVVSWGRSGGWQDFPLLIYGDGPDDYMSFEDFERLLEVLEEAPLSQGGQTPE